MTTGKHVAHPARLQAPWYQTSGRAALHRYLDADFIKRFQRDVSEGKSADPLPVGVGKTLPVLPLPLHRSFHVFCCEVTCACFGHPALDPARIESAGFVIRRQGGDQEMAWTMEDGIEVGWQPVVGGQRDPDVHRRIAALGLKRRQTGSGFVPYAGEVTHPLHPWLLRDRDGCNHTLLFGYLPLGGSYYQRETPDASDLQDFVDEAAQSLPWPFGFRDRARKPGKRYREPHFVLVQAGVPSGPFHELLRVLVSRYHLGESGLDDNAALLALCDRLVFEHGGTLAAYLTDCFAAEGGNPLVAWLARNDELREASAQTTALPLPTGAGVLTGTLSLSAADAQEFRQLLGQRLLTQVGEAGREIPLPRFAQGDDDVFRVIPFVRYRDECDCVRIHWAEDAACSELFRVASPHDPESSRPSLVQMPSLSDLRRGMARGVSMLTPPDTFAMLNAIRLGKGVSSDAVPEQPPGGGGGLQWICSFSLPVVTLVAMILLMIMVTLFNLLFFWLPWVRICLPFPKIGKKGGSSG